MSNNTLYKDSPLGKIPSKWIVKTLGEACVLKEDYGINASAVCILTVLIYIHCLFTGECQLHGYRFHHGNTNDGIKHGCRAISKHTISLYTLSTVTGKIFPYFCLIFLKLQIAETLSRLKQLRLRL